MIHYVSTRGQAGRRSFEDVLLAGLAEDGGLFVPESWPAFSAAELRRLRGLDYPALAARLLAPFTGGCFDEADLLRLARRAYADFDHPATAPLRHLGRRRVAARAVPRADPGLQGLRDAAAGRDVRRGAGAARASGSPSSAPPRATPARPPSMPSPASAQIRIAMLHPEGRVSPVQRRQMTTVHAPQRAQPRRSAARSTTARTW